MKYPWFAKLKPEHAIEQGDIFYNVPAIEPISADIDRGESITANVIKLDVIIMTQSCDLGHGKVNNVTVCPITNFQQHILNNFDSVGKRKGHAKKLKRGEDLRYHLLNEEPGIVNGLYVVDLKNVFGVSYKLLEKLKSSQKDRVRLLPPYREHLSQAFARVYMRIGLPIDISEEELLKKATNN